MRDFLYHDLIVKGNECNLKCSYCTSTETANDYEPGEATLPVMGTAGPATRFLIDSDRALAVVDAFLARSNAPLLKVSGGEIFLYRNAPDLIEALSQRYAYVQVLTNGTTVSPALIDRLARLGNVGINLSLDGHTPEMNSSRWRSDVVSRRVLGALEALLDGLGEVEITTVVTDINAPGYESFLDFLEDLPGRPISFPIPVRGITAPALFRDEARRAFAERFPALQERHARLLPPAAYGRRLARFLGQDGGVREDRCHIVHLTVQMFDTGAVTPCPVGWTVSLGNIWEDGADEVFAQVGTHKMYDLMTRPRPRVPVCRSCFSLTDVINLYLDGEVSPEEMARLPMYRPEPVQSRLRDLRARVERTGSAAPLPS